MGRAWDYDVPEEAIFAECLRVLRPGGHMLAFSSSRTYRRMACRIEDAGFEIRDQLMWITGIKFVCDLAASCITIGALAGFLPTIAAVLGIVW